MRLGAQTAHLVEGGIAHSCYQSQSVSERHRHRYEFNNVYRNQFIANGLKFSGLSPDEALVEIIELADHPWFLAVQYHPEFKSKPTQAQPLFVGFVEAAIQRHHLIRPKEGRRGENTEESSSQPESASETSITDSN